MPVLVDGERRVSLNGIEHWVRISGAGRLGLPVIALHGGPGGNHYVFERTVLPGLARSMMVICYEQRGCGRSARPLREDDYALITLVADLDELRRILGLTQVVLLGYSFGAELALEYALVHPANVAALVLQAPSGIADPDEAAGTQLAGFREVGVDVDRIEQNGRRPVRELLARIWSQTGSTVVDRFLFEDPAAAQRNRAFWQESGLENTGLMERVVERERPQRPRLIDRVGHARVPVLVLVGRHDRNVGVRACATLVAALPDATLHVFERSAHFPDLEETDAYLQAVEAFLIGRGLVLAGGSG